MSVSRVRENLMHGLTGGGWKRDVGHGRSESCPGETLDRGAETYRRSAPPRQPPTLLRHGASKATFCAIDSFVRERLMRWIRAKYAGKTELSMKELRRRFCDQGWRFAHNGVVFTGASSVAVTRYRYRGNTIPTPRAPAASS